MHGLHFSYVVHAPFPRPSVVSLVCNGLHTRFIPGSAVPPCRYTLVLNTSRSLRVVSFVLHSGGIALAPDVVPRSSAAAQPRQRPSSVGDATDRTGAATSRSADVAGDGSGGGSGDDAIGACAPTGNNAPVDAHAGGNGVRWWSDSTARFLSTVSRPVVSAASHALVDRSLWVSPSEECTMDVGALLGRLIDGDVADFDARLVEGFVNQVSSREHDCCVAVLMFDHRRVVVLICGLALSTCASRCARTCPREMCIFLCIARVIVRELAYVRCTYGWCVCASSRASTVRRPSSCVV